MTAEVVFAKTFLSVLDTKPSKLASDHAVDARTLEITHAYTLPRYPNATPMKRRLASVSGDNNAAGTTTANTTGAPLSEASLEGGPPGSERAVSVVLKSAKNPTLELKLPAEAISTSVLSLKQRVAAEVGLPNVEKVRLLWRKKPVGDAKTLKEIIGDEGLKGLELGVMVIGGVPEKSKTATTTAAGTEGNGESTTVPVAQGESGEEVLATEKFWEDLQGFLEQRVRDQDVAERASKRFRDAWSRGN